MKLTFPTFSEVLSALDLMDASRPSPSRPATCLLFKNVRCFKDWSIVPLSRLNVLTGPNSAGKSTIGELLALLGQCFSQGDLNAFGRERAGLIVGFSVDWQEWGAVFIDGVFEWGSVDIFTSSLSSVVRDRFLKAKLPKPHPLQPRRLTYVMERNGDYENTYTNYIYGDAECLSAMRFEEYPEEPEEDAQRFRVSPKLFRYLYVEKFCSEIDEILSWLSSWKKPGLGSHHLPGSFDKKLKEYMSPISPVGGHYVFDTYEGPIFRFDETFYSAEDACFFRTLLCAIFYQPLYLMHKFGGDTFGKKKILPAVRQISSPEQLTYRFDLRKRLTNKENTDGAFASLARILFEDEIQYRNRVNKPGQKELEKVNAFLYSALGSSHTLRHRIKESVSHEKGKKDSEYEVKLFLQGSDGVELSLADVGTGISQVLPVIASGVGNSVSIYKQPELHLHPRAQSGLADFFIDAINADEKRALTLETHSEHLILRFLRRIRERHTRKSKLRLNALDLSLIYLNPTETGSEVHFIRVDDNGDFLDPWPAGFFEDRYEDLFFTNK